MWREKGEPDHASPEGAVGGPGFAGVGLQCNKSAS